MLALLASLFYIVKEGDRGKGITWHSTIDEILVFVNLLIDLWLLYVTASFLKTEQQCEMIRGKGEDCSYAAFWYC
jgi:hypothetical protein